MRRNQEKLHERVKLILWSVSGGLHGRKGRKSTRGRQQECVQRPRTARLGRTWWGEELCMCGYWPLSFLLGLWYSGIWGRRHLYLSQSCPDGVLRPWDWSEGGSREWDGNLRSRWQRGSRVQHWASQWLSGKESPPKQATWVWSLDWEDPLEKEMATHCSILAWKVPWTEEAGGLQSTRSQRVGHNLATERQSTVLECGQCHLPRGVSSFTIKLRTFSILHKQSGSKSFSVWKQS